MRSWCSRCTTTASWQHSSIRSPPAPPAHGLPRTQGDLERLVELLQELERRHPGAPLLTVSSRSQEEGCCCRYADARRARGSSEDGGAASEASGFVGADGTRDAEDWELV
jgi:hypothetical protein